MLVLVVVCVYVLWVKATTTPSMVLHSRELVVRRKGGAKKAAENWSAAELDDLELVRARKKEKKIILVVHRKSVTTFSFFWFEGGNAGCDAL